MSQPIAQDRPTEVHAFPFERRNGTRYRRGPNGYIYMNSFGSNQRTQVERIGHCTPVLGESFCHCLKHNEQAVSCKCGEDDDEFEWTWDTENKSSSAHLSSEGRDIKFHTEFSCGTAAVRGSKPMKDGQYYWEIKMTTPVYGTDMMVGVGTPTLSLDQFKYSFCSMLGMTADSWGYSYTGNLHHQAKLKRFGSRFGQGSIVGVHLDMWNGTLTFYKNKKSLGIAYTGLNGKTLYPVVCSTAARSGMKMITSRSYPSSLMFMCCQKLRDCVPEQMSVLEALPFPPGLRGYLNTHLSWLLGTIASCHGSKRKLVDNDETEYPVVVVSTKKTCLEDQPVEL